MKTIREFVLRLLQGCGDIDDNCRVKICRRDEEGVVTHIALCRVPYIDCHDNICIEEKDINWQLYATTTQY